ncbi:metal-dependent hydrolase [Pseudidiomarina aestuarii]|uniref:Metal-dependent hydrolase n=1 Tax=Pseudidiomarina aestuarii TaxID=624146 RepID=A0A7Z7EUQ8_9GAMM|nr:amidohydrolase family protein [Pseudidiomarina aestuarii]RUO42039.1 metal-dependent hydrolase [Pseudidiomarina aestuarii]
MKTKLIILAVITLIVATLLLLPTPQQPNASNDNSFVLGPVRIFDGERVIEANYIEINEGIIVALHSNKPDLSLRWVDGANQWVIPGLIDSHVHAWGDALEQSVERGVTTVIDMFGDPNFLAQSQAQRATTEFTTAADMYGAGLLMTAPDGHGTQYGIDVSTLDSPEQAAQLVQQRIDAGSDFIKIVYTAEGAGYQHAPSISKAGLEAAIAAAHQQKRLAVVHIADYNSAVDAVAAGADGLVHSFFNQPITDELLTMMQANDVFVIPTTVVYEGMLRGEINDEVLFNESQLDISRAAQSTLNQSFPDTNRFPEHYYENLMETTQRMHDAGVRVLAGSDAPNPNTAHGWSLVVEMLLLQQAGMSAEAVLTAATAGPADAFKLTDRGRIQVGNKADLLVLTESPLDSLESLLTPAMIWKNGYRIR